MLLLLWCNAAVCLWMSTDRPQRLRTVKSDAKPKRSRDKDRDREHRRDPRKFSSEGDSAAAAAATAAPAAAPLNAKHALAPLAAHGNVMQQPLPSPQLSTTSNKSKPRKVGQLSAALSHASPTAEANPMDLRVAGTSTGTHSMGGTAALNTSGPLHGTERRKASALSKQVVLPAAETAENNVLAPVSVKAAATPLVSLHSPIRTPVAEPARSVALAVGRDSNPVANTHAAPIAAPMSAASPATKSTAAAAAAAVQSATVSPSVAVFKTPTHAPSESLFEKGSGNRGNHDLDGALVDAELGGTLPPQARETRVIRVIGASGATVDDSSSAHLEFKARVAAPPRDSPPPSTHKMVFFDGAFLCPYCPLAASCDVLLCCLPCHRHTPDAPTSRIAPAASTCNGWRRQRAWAQCDVCSWAIHRR